MPSRKSSPASAVKWAAASCSSAARRPSIIRGRGPRSKSCSPVTIDADPGLTDLDQPFHLHMTNEALRNPIFQITDGGDNAAAWQTLPTFTHYGRVENAKPGAIVWAEHDQDVGPHGKRILMSAQSYGAGRSAVICVQNFLALASCQNSDPTQSTGSGVNIFATSARPGARASSSTSRTSNSIRRPICMSCWSGRKPRPDLAATPGATPRARIHHRGERAGPKGNPAAKFEPASRTGRAPSPFHARQKASTPSTIFDDHNIGVAERSIQLTNTKPELERTGRDMENLRQWAALTQGTAFGEEDLKNVSPLIDAIHKEMQLAETQNTSRLPLGLTAGF